MQNIIRFSASAYACLKNTVGAYSPESGAIIGSPIADPSYITRVWFDTEAGSGKIVYSPTADRINDIVQRWSREEGHRFIGVVHSHHDGYAALSSVDLHSAAAIMRSNGRLPFLYLGLFHRGKLSMFKVLADDGSATCTTEELQILIDPPIQNQL